MSEILASPKIQEMRYADVALSLDHVSSGAYTYKVPAGMALKVGCRVVAPFNKTSVQGYVTAISGKRPKGITTREIIKADSLPLLSEDLIALAQLMSKKYWASLSSCLEIMLPIKIRKEGTKLSSRQTTARRSNILVRLETERKIKTVKLNQEQNAALADLHSNREILLHGIAASGKTEVYIEAAKECISRGKQALLLIPEFALTSQLLDRFTPHFAGRIGILTSSLSDSERAAQWAKISAGGCDLVIGTRTAVFAPLRNLGLICVDEEGASSYQEERTPRYETGWVARQRARITRSECILGSATPSLALYKEAQEGAIKLTRLRQRVVGKMAEIEIVDMRLERSANIASPISRRLERTVNLALSRKEQVILYLNRLGGRSLYICKECGEAVRCPHCSISLTQEDNSEWMICHYCGHTREVPTLCPSCGKPHVYGVGMGTSRLEHISKYIWKGARVMRIDSEVGNADAISAAYDEFENGDADILVGSQLVARGLDLPRVSLVGIIDGDIALNLPDFRSAENTFSSILQAAGRAGRGETPSHVILQTRNPGHYSLKFAAENDYVGFYKAELELRNGDNYPPYKELATITHMSSTDEGAEAGIHKFALELNWAIKQKNINDIVLDGPAPGIPHKIRDKYRWQITLRGNALQRLQEIVPKTSGWVCEVIS